MILAGAYVDTVTYWASRLDNFGNRSFSAPALIKCRWQEANELVTLPTGETIPSKAIIYLQQAVAVGDYLALGDYSAILDPTVLNGANIIRMYDESRSVNGRTAIRKAVL